MQWAKQGRAPNQIAQKDVKLCALCDALNHRNGDECFLCGWRGQFETNAQQIALAWKRLEDQYEEVRLEHVTGLRKDTVQELGTVAQRTPAQLLAHSVRSWWRGFLHARDQRAAEREAALRPNRIKHSAQ